jgi:uncharacterized membrane protein YedE/YeeE
MGITWQAHSSVLALLGGILIGAVAVVRHAIVGKITGISGILNGSTIYKLNKFPYDEKLFKILFTLGVCLGGLLCYFLFPQAFVDWSKIPIERLLISGFLVGLGSAIGNGCTSGHGVCGISSLRLRSMVATGVFMTTGILTAIFTKSLSYFPEFDNQLDMSSASIAFAVALIICMLLYYIGNLLSRGKIINDEYQKRHFVTLTEFLTGVIFAVGMAVSNMSMNSATLSFLDLTVWNPALIFVMGGAICLAAPLFYFTNTKGTPFLATKFDLPTSKDIDLQLITGSGIFGIGWGLSGVCPGPALTNIFNLQSGYRPFLLIICMIFGFWSKEFCFDQYEKNKYAPVEPLPLISKQTDLSSLEEAKSSSG